MTGLVGRPGGRPPSGLLVTQSREPNSARADSGGRYLMSAWLACTAMLAGSAMVGWAAAGLWHGGLG